MYNNFLEQTILTGNIDEIYLKNIPNSLLMQNNKKYRLSIENECFICKIQVFSFNNEIRNVVLPINTNSTNFKVYWGDDSSTQIIELDCRDIYKNDNTIKLFPGAAYIEYEEKDQIEKAIINIYNGNEFIKFEKINNDVTRNNSNNISSIINCNTINSQYALKIEKNPLYANEYNLYNYIGDIISHKYLKQASYYIKIYGGFTGFNNKNTNYFYRVGQSQAINQNIIKIPYIENLNISGIYNKINISSNNKQLYKVENDTIEKYIEILQQNTILYWKNSQQQTTYFSGILSGNLKKENAKISLIYYDEQVQSIISWTNDVEKVVVEQIKLTEILSWGTNTNWQDMNYAFCNAKYLTSIPKTALPNVNEFISCFENCQNLKIDNPDSIMPPATINTTNMFYNSNISGNLSAFVMAPYNSIITNMFNIVQRKQYLPNNYYKFQYISGKIDHLSINIRSNYSYDINQHVTSSTVSAFFNYNLALNQYLIQGQDNTWKNYTEPIILYENKKIHFKSSLVDSISEEIILENEEIYIENAFNY